MDSSLIIGKILGIFFFFGGLAMLLDTVFYGKVVKDILKSPGLFVLRAFTSFIVGTIVVIFHNIWNQNWEMIITIIGWLIMIQGGLCLIFPKSITANLKTVTAKGMLWIYWIWLVVGAFLMYMSFYYAVQFPQY